MQLCTKNQSNSVDSFVYYKQKCKVASFNLGHTVDAACHNVSNFLTMYKLEGISV